MGRIPSEWIGGMAILSWNGGGYSGFDYGLSPEAWGGYPYGRPYIYPLGVP